MKNEKLSNSLERIKTKCPTFGVENSDLKNEIANYKSYYRLELQNCFYQYGYIKALNEFLFVQRFAHISQERRFYSFMDI